MQTANQMPAADETNPLGLDDAPTTVTGTAGFGVFSLRESEVCPFE